MLACVTNAGAVTTSGWHTVTIQSGGTEFKTNNVTIPAISYGDLTATGAVTVVKIEKYLDTKAQTFTAAAGYEIITNLTTRLSSGDWTSTQTNITTGVAGDYLVLISASLASDTVNVACDVLLYTNGVAASSIGWRRKIAVANDVGSAAGNGLINLDANVNCSLRLDIDVNATITFDHLSWCLINL